MKNKPVRLRQVSAQQASATDQIGRGLQCTVVGNDHPLQLQLRVSDHHEDSLSWVILNTAAGSLMLEQERAEALLNQWSGAPFVLAVEDNAERPWYTQIYNARLYDTANELFGFIEPSDEFPATGIACRFDTTVDGRTDFCRAIIPYTTLSRMLERGQWRKAAPWRLPDLQLTWPVCLGRLSLPRKVFRRLQSGDVLLPSEVIFDTNGNGSVQFGNRRLQLQYAEQGTQFGFVVTQTSVSFDKDDSMDTENDPQPFDDQGTVYEEPEARQDEYAVNEDDQSASYEDMIADDFDAVVSLSIRCGQVSMSLSQLGQLTEGSVLMVAGERPGHAAVYHRNRVVARGELVDVDGQLGLQITGLEQSL